MRNGLTANGAVRCGRTDAGIDAELGGGFSQGFGLFFQRFGGGGLFHQRGVLLGHFVHLNHGLVDLVDAGTLFYRGRRNIGHDVGDALYGHDDFIHGLARFIGQFAAKVDPKIRTVV